MTWPAISARPYPEVRKNLYTALLAFLQYARPARAAQLPGSVLAVARGAGALEAAGDGSGEMENGGGGGDGDGGGGGGGGSAARSMAVRAAAAAAAAQDELEAGTSALIRRDAAPLIELLARDAADGAEEAGTAG